MDVKEFDGLKSWLGKTNGLEKEPSTMLTGATHENDYRLLSAGLATKGWHIIEAAPPDDNMAGMTQWNTRAIFIKESLTPDQKFATLAHEAAHAFHGPVHAPEGATEVFAESTAYLVTRARGLDTAEYSAAYLDGGSVSPYVIDMFAPVTLRAAKQILALFPAN